MDDRFKIKTGGFEAVTKCDHLSGSFVILLQRPHLHLAALQ